MKKPSPVVISAAVLGTACITYYIICGFVFSFALSGLWIWLAFGLILFFGCSWSLIAEPRIPETVKCGIYKKVRTACLSLFALFMLIFAVFEGFLIYEWSEGTDTDDVHPDTVIILGGAVEYDRPGDTLGWRIDTAYEFIRDNPDVTVITCGGIGEGDIISEAQCIKNELVRRGISENMIITEESSVSTSENFAFAASLLPEDAKNVIVITSGFHQFRAIRTGYTAFDKAGITNIRLIPLSAPCTSLQLPCYMVREFAAFTKSLFAGNIQPGGK